MKLLSTAKVLIFNRKVTVAQIPVLLGIGSFISVNYASNYKDLNIYSKSDKIVCLFLLKFFNSLINFFAKF